MTLCPDYPNNLPYPFNMPCWCNLKSWLAGYDAATNGSRISECPPSDEPNSWKAGFIEAAVKGLPWPECYAKVDPDGIGPPGDFAYEMTDAKWNALIDAGVKARMKQEATTLSASDIVVLIAYSIVLIILTIMVVWKHFS